MSENKAILAGIIFLGLILCPGLARSDSTRTVLFLGDSLAAGYGLSEEQAYPAIIEGLAKGEGISVKCVNAGVSGDTTAGGLRRLSWMLRQQVDVLVIALGGNDALRGIDPAESKKNIGAMVDKYSNRFPKGVVLIAGMKSPPNMGEDYGKRFEKIYEELAVEKHVALLTFLLEGVAGKPELNQADGIHPNALGQKRIAQNVWPLLSRLLSQQPS